MQKTERGWACPCGAAMPVTPEQVIDIPPGGVVSCHEYGRHFSKVQDGEWSVLIPSLKFSPQKPKEE